MYVCIQINTHKHIHKHTNIHTHAHAYYTYLYTHTRTRRCADACTLSPFLTLSLIPSHPQTTLSVCLSLFVSCLFLRVFLSLCFLVFLLLSVFLPLSLSFSRTHPHTHTHRKNAHTNTRTHTHAFAYVCVCMYIHVYTYTNTYTHTHTYTHTQTRTHAYTLICNLHTLVQHVYSPHVYSTKRDVKSDYDTATRDWRAATRVARDRAARSVQNAAPCHRRSLSSNSQKMCFPPPASRPTGVMHARMHTCVCVQY